MSAQTDIQVNITNCTGYYQYMGFNITKCTKVDEMTVRNKVKQKDGSTLSMRTLNRDKIATMLLANVTIKEIARKCKVKPATIYKLMKEPEIQEILEEAHALTRMECHRQTGEMITPALEVIMKQINDGDGKLAFMFLDKIGALGSAGKAAGFETDTKNDQLKVVINVSGHANIAANGEDSHIADIKSVEVIQSDSDKLE